MKYITQSETYAFELRELYAGKGYKLCRMSRFEEYDFYADKKDFLTSSAVLTFTDLNGKLMALRPDVTLSLIRRGVSGKYSYNEKVYRPDENMSSFREISQSGIECLGELTPSDFGGVVELALLSLKVLAGGKRHYVLDVADAGEVRELLEGCENPNSILKCLGERNVHGLNALNAPEKVIDLLSSNKKLSGFNGSIIDGLSMYHENIKVDYSAVSNLKYYNGLVFRGYIEGCAYCVLSGGQYDGILRSMNSSLRNGAGFAVYLDRVKGLKND